MTPMADQSCEDCRFWVLGNDDAIVDPVQQVQSGECRRHAPTLVMIQVPDVYREHCSIPKDPSSFEPDPVEMARRVWPRTYAYDWCGEFEEAPDA
jgi:hypothetical protein